MKPLVFQKRVVKTKNFISLAVAATVLGSCSHRSTPPTEIIGVWKLASTSAVGTEDASWMYFGEDKSVTLHKVPDSFFKSPDRTTGKTISASGKWEIDRTNSSRVALLLSWIDGKPVNYSTSGLTVESNSDGVILFYLPGDSYSERVNFVRWR